MAKIICILVRVNIYSSHRLGDLPQRPMAGGEGGSYMSRIYSEPVNVQARDDGRPARFVWHGRLYTVQAILEHWVINREWWQDPTAEPGQPELEFWRIEASSGQGLTAGVYELRRDAATDAWTLRLGA